MSNRIVNLDTATHQTVQELLPWFVTDRLEGSELVLVREHLQTCSQCRADVDFQRKLQAAEPQPTAMPDIEAAWAKMQPQLDRPRPMAWRDALAAWVRRMTDSRGAWMPWALAAQFAARHEYRLLLRARELIRFTGCIATSPGPSRYRSTCSSRSWRRRARFCRSCRAPRS